VKNVNWYEPIVILFVTLITVASLFVVVSWGISKSPKDNSKVLKSEGQLQVTMCMAHFGEGTEYECRLRHGYWGELVK